jgi:hypothetical protein
VLYIPAAAFRALPGAWVALEITRWASPILGIIFFGFFGLAGESLAFYRQGLKRLAAFFGGRELQKMPM